MTQTALTVERYDVDSLPQTKGPAAPRLSTGARCASGAALVVAGSVAIQGSAVLGHSLFAELTPAGVSGLRFLLAALIGVLIIRPSWRGRTAAQWAGIAAYGATIAGMNVAMFQALEVLPLGVAVTLELLGPLAVAATRLPRHRHLALPALCLVGVVLVCRPGGSASLAGVLFGCAAAVSLAAYTLVAERVSRQATVGGGWHELSLALVVAAVLTLPFALPVAPHVEPRQWLVLLAAAVVGVLVAFSLDYLAVRLTSARNVAIFLSFDPVLATLLGAVLLSQAVDLVTLIGCALVIVSGVAVACVHAAAGARPADQSSPK